MNGYTKQVLPNGKRVNICNQCGAPISRGSLGLHLRNHADPIPPADPTREREERNR